MYDPSIMFGDASIVTVGAVTPYPEPPLVILIDETFPKRGSTTHVAVA